MVLGRNGSHFFMCVHTVLVYLLYSTTMKFFTTAMTILMVCISMLTAKEIYTIGANSYSKYEPEGREVIGWEKFSKSKGKMEYELSGVADGQDFSCLISLSPLSKGQKLEVSKKKHLGGSGADSGSDDMFKKGEGVIITVSDLKGNVSFDGFRTFSAANARGKEGCKVNGTVYEKSINGIDKMVVFSLGDGTSVLPEFEFEAVTNHQLRWVELQFSKGRGLSRKTRSRSLAVDKSSSGKALICVGGIRLIIE